ncbi:MAG: hypothetical protein WD271_03250 [Acidimicrobiia bacterium]
MPTGGFEERYSVGDEATETEPRLLSAATGPVSQDERAGNPGTVPWHRRRAQRVGLAALLVIAVFSALLLRCGESTSPVKSATPAAPRATPGQRVQIPPQGFTPLPPDSIFDSYFTFPSIFGNPNGSVGGVTGGGFAFTPSLPGAWSGAVPAPAGNWAPVAPSETAPPDVSGSL